MDKPDTVAALKLSLPHIIVENVLRRQLRLPRRPPDDLRMRSEHSRGLVDHDHIAIFV